MSVTQDHEVDAVRSDTQASHVLDQAIGRATRVEKDLVSRPAGRDGGDKRKAMLRANGIDRVPTL